MLLANHGPIVSGSSLEEAVYAYEELEETAKLFFILGDRKTSPLRSRKLPRSTGPFPTEVAQEQGRIWVYGLIITIMGGYS